MKRLLSLTATFIIAGTLTAQAVGPVYTIPADYEKMKKMLEGLSGKKLTEIEVRKAETVGKNVRAFVRGASGYYVNSGNPENFQNVGDSYRKFVKGAVGIDPLSNYDGSYSNSFENAGNNYRYFGEGITYQKITTDYSDYKYAGQNVRKLAEGMTGKKITDSSYTAFENAGKNVKSFAEGVTGKGITEDYSSEYKYAGRNIRDLGYAITGEEITKENTASTATVDDSDKSPYGYRAYQFKMRADQTFYDTYVNDKALKKSFKFANGFDPNKYKSGLTTITKDNEVDVGGSGGLGVGSLWYRYWNGKEGKFVQVFKKNDTWTESKHNSLTKEEQVCFDPSYTGYYWILVEGIDSAGESSYGIYLVEKETGKEIARSSLGGGSKKGISTQQLIVRLEKGKRYCVEGIHHDTIGVHGHILVIGLK